MIFDRNFDFLADISIFHKIFDFWRKVGFWCQISVEISFFLTEISFFFDRNFVFFDRNFVFFDRNFIFWQKVRFWHKFFDINFFLKICLTFLQAVSQAGPSAWSLPELVNTKPGRPKAPKQIIIKNIGTESAQVTWSVGLCVTGGAVQQYELRLDETGYYDTRTITENQNDEKDLNEEDSRIQFKNQNKQGRHIFFCKCTQFAVLSQNYDFWGQNLDFELKFGFLNQNFDFESKFRFWVKISILSQNFDFESKFGFWVKI